MARKSYSEQLVKLKEDVLKMGAMVEEAICLAVKSLKEGDVSWLNRWLMGMMQLMISQ